MSLFHGFTVDDWFDDMWFDVDPSEVLSEMGLPLSAWWPEDEGEVPAGLMGEFGEIF